MTKTFIRITRYPYEEPCHVNLVLQVSNESCSGKLDFYTGTDSLVEIADGLKGFPQHKDRVFLWELGSERPEDRWAYYLRFRVFVLDPSGRSAIQIRVNNNKELPEREIFEFCITAMPADLDRLANLMRTFSELKHNALEWKVTDGRLYNKEEDA